LVGRRLVRTIFIFFVVPRQFSQDIGEWPQNQILIPDPTKTQQTKKKKS